MRLVMGKAMNNVFGISIEKILLVLIVVMPSLLQAQEKEFALISAGDQFIETVVALRKSVAIKDPYPIVRAIANGFKMERDFGGLYNPAENAVVNFLAVFPLDEHDVRQEYRGEGWQQLESILQSKTFIARSKINRCLPNGKYQNDIVHDEMLCFTQAESGAWRITSFVNAGD